MTAASQVNSFYADLCLEKNMFRLIRIVKSDIMHVPLREERSSCLPLCMTLDVKGVWFVVAL